MKIGVVGSGTMGRGIVQILSECPDVSSVIWAGSCIDRLNKSCDMLMTGWAKLVKKRRVDSDDVEAFSCKIVRTTKFEKFSNCEIVIEAVAENYESKDQVFSQLCSIVSNECVIATNTSSLSITALAAKIPNPHRVVGLHFFNPAPIMKLTEIVIGLTTSNQTIDKVISFSKLLQKEPVKVNEAPGFIVNRMLIPMINEGIGILAEGVASADEIDKAMKLGANHPIGPLALSDLIGNDVVLSIMEALYQETGDQKYRANPLLRKIVRAGKLGRKTNEGFFTY